MLVILETMDISRLSQNSKCGDEKAGYVRKMCRRLGRTKD